MYKLGILGLSTLLTTSLAVHAAALENKPTSHKEWAPRSLAVKVMDASNKQVESLLKMQKNKKRNIELESETVIFVANFVTDGAGKVGEVTNIESFVNAYIQNNSNEAKNYYVETSACTDFLIADNCAELVDIYSLKAHSEMPIGQKVTIQYKFDKAGEHHPTTYTQVTELKEPTLEFKGTFSARSVNFGKLVIE